MPGNTRRARPRSSRKDPDFKAWTSGTAGDWLARWEAAVPHAAAMYAAAVRLRADQAIEKYLLSLQRFVKHKRSIRKSRPGA